MGNVIFIRGQGTPFADAAPVSRPRLPAIRRAASYLAVTGVGLSIGVILGTFAALMMGLIALC